MPLWYFEESYHYPWNLLIYMCVMMNFYYLNYFNLVFFFYLQPKASSQILVEKEAYTTLKLWNFVHGSGTRMSSLYEICQNM